MMTMDGHCLSPYPFQPASSPLSRYTMTLAIQNIINSLNGVNQRGLGTATAACSVLSTSLATGRAPKASGSSLGAAILYVNYALGRWGE